MKKIIIILPVLVFFFVSCGKDDKQSLTKEECEKDETKQWNAEANEGKGACETKKTVTKEECEKDATKQWNATANEGKGACEAKVKTSSEIYVDECNKIHDQLRNCYKRSFSSIGPEMQKCDDNHDKSAEELFKKFLKAEQLSEMQARSREIRNPLIGPECRVTTEEWLGCYINIVFNSRQVFCVTPDQINLAK